jgi:hypothetical protein
MDFSSDLLGEDAITSERFADFLSIEEEEARIDFPDWD